MHNDKDIPTGSPLEDCWLPLEQVAAACAVEPEWLLRHIEDGLFVGMASVGGTWRFSTVGLARARRMRELERNFDAVPELAALVADMLEEMDRLRARLRRAGLT
ncbi:MerR family transcriptional regulator [Azoarcus indigens]|uniref:Chaperone modulatory protein CbpM n=1 Tax=Azoarcus indigens TaxID=29545 RepID=A0A4R6EFC5_9RHOO|nr:chaperone modulator CbpM [Azoarcus indigens]NMG63422.1 MerR family transcriptional regulator [Azoarcus indigens]TDN56974.1 chaperone modulatory protein CbpM [Azoarcus indigens]